MLQLCALERELCSNLMRGGNQAWREGRKALWRGMSNTPQKLTLCPAPQLDWSRPEAPASDAFGDIYFSVEGGLAETEAVFLKACGLPERWQGRSQFTVAELGFGTGLNFLALLRLWRKTRCVGQCLDFVSVEKYPLDKDTLAKALSHFPELSDLAASLLVQWPGRVRGIHRLHFDGGVTLTLIHEDVKSGLSGLDFKADAWFLDGFSPAKNPDMWSSDIMALVGTRAAPGCRVGTFTAAGFVRDGLSRAGFKTDKVAGFGRKRHRLEAVMPGERAERAQLRPVIIGAGIAGASLAAGFLRRGITPIVIDAQDGRGASGNPAAIIKPRLDRQDKPESRFFLSCYLYALQRYDAVDCVLSRGIFHAAKSPEDAKRFEDLVQLSPLPPRHMYSDAGPFELQGLRFPAGLVINPAKALAYFLGGAERVKGRAANIHTADGVYTVQNAEGQILATGSHIFWTIGAGIKAITDFDTLEMRYSRGQLSWAQNGVGLDKSLTYGGYAIPMGEALLLGATHERVDGEGAYALRAEDDAKNLGAFSATCGRVVKPLDRPGRASIRVNSKTTLPVIAHRANVSALTGLGSRGFVFAPLICDALAAEAIGAPSGLAEGLFRKVLSVD